MIAATLLVNLSTLIGVAFLVPAVAKLQGRHRKRFEATVAAFAAGALLSAAVFLLLFESTHYVATGWDKVSLPLPLPLPLTLTLPQPLPLPLTLTLPLTLSLTLTLTLTLTQTLTRRSTSTGGGARW